MWDDSPPIGPSSAQLRVVLITATLAWNRLSRLADQRPPVREGYPLAIANGVLVVAYFGLALQFFLLRFGRRGTNC